jgi:cold shock protein
VSRAAPRGVVKDLFAHHTGINANSFKALAEGARVSFDAEADDKGPKAVNVTAQ